jgi:hypothetical protein
VFSALHRDEVMPVNCEFFICRAVNYDSTPAALPEMRMRFDLRAKREYRRLHRALGNDSKNESRSKSGRHQGKRTSHRNI